MEHYASPMTTLALKLALTPLLMTVATLSVRRWGPGVGGWIVGLPLTSGPISLFLALERGPSFAARAAISTILGIIAVAATVLTYAFAAQRWQWPLTTALSLIAFVTVAAMLRDVAVSPLAAFAATVIVLVIAVSILPQGGRPAAGSSPRWDLPARIVVAVSMVLAITAAAETLGPELSGLLSPFPVFTLVTAVFEHRRSGGGIAAPYARGLLTSLVGFSAFFLVVSLLLGRFGLLTFAMATLVSLLTSAAAAAVAHRYSTRSA